MTTGGDSGNPGIRTRRRLETAVRAPKRGATSAVHFASKVFNRYTLIVIYLVAGTALSITAYHLQHEGFTPPPQPGQVYVTVFEQNPAAELQLAATIDATDPAADKVTVTDLSGNPGRWLVVIECPSQLSASQSNAVMTNAYLYQETPTQSVHALPGAAPGSSEVIAWLGHPIRAHQSHPFELGCFTSEKGPFSIDNVALPALGTDQAITNEASNGIEGLPELYREGATLAEIIGNAACPGSTTTAGAGSSTSTSPSVSASATASGSASPSTSIGPSGSASLSTSSTPAAEPSSPPPPLPQNPACFFGGSLTDPPSQYFLPTTLTTKEKVTQVNLNGGWVLQSQFPTGQTDNDTITWEGAAGLSPDIHVDNPSADSTANQAAFLSGILWGIVGGAGVSLVDHLERVNHDLRKLRARKTGKPTDNAKPQESEGSG
jgi:hypothetical protein